MAIFAGFFEIALQQFNIPAGTAAKPKRKRSLTLSAQHEPVERGKGTERADKYLADGRRLMKAGTPSQILIWVIALFGSALTGAPASADDWDVCRSAAARMEQQHNMPKGMMTSIALVESGRRSPTGDVKSWPWTINAEGRAYYFATRNDAVDAVRRLMADGMRTIDIGCMQVNLRFHPRAFTSVEEAFDPMSNVAYAAYFLRDLETRSESWDQAIGRYHSFSPALNARYSARVQAVWGKERETARANPSQRPVAAEVSKAQNVGLRLSSYSDELQRYSDDFTEASVIPGPITLTETASLRQ